MPHKFRFQTLSICLNLNVTLFTVMTLDEKVRYGMMAVGGASIVLTALGVHVGPLMVATGAGD